MTKLLKNGRVSELSFGRSKNATHYHSVFVQNRWLREMYIVTYYSFKGGVGRTMALVNTAAELAVRGRRVLLVDFDLEAPGITTYAAFEQARENPGMVDYVTSYIATGAAPAIAEYVSECSIGGHPIWLMSAGKTGSGYAGRLSSIDWQKLYSEHSGYLMFEDMKQQWEQLLSPSFDYVLIDSRTGHTDVGGICTRQLPNAVVMLFVPNDQNIDGLASVAQTVRSSKRGDTRARLLFCPSNVPDLDDEDHILRKQLDKAKSRLRYARPAAVINHYSSLAIIDQAVFVLDRPRTRLSEQYRRLASAVIKENPADLEGAVARIEELSAVMRSSNRFDGSSEIPFLSTVEAEVENIRALHSHSGEVAWALAELYRIMGALESENDALSVAIEAGTRTVEAKLRRAANALSQRLGDAAQRDLHDVLLSENATIVDVSAALGLLQSADLEWNEQIESSPALARMGTQDQLQIATSVAVDDEGVRISVRLAERALATSVDPEQRHSAMLLLVLGQIAFGDFGLAMRNVASGRQEMLSSEDIQSVFNFAVAAWGAEGEPDEALFARVLSLNDDRKNAAYYSANYFQCIALAAAVSGKAEETRSYLERARAVLGPGMTFSCWRYLRVRRDEMREDFKAIEKFASGQGSGPPFLRGKGIATVS